MKFFRLIAPYTASFLLLTLVALAMPKQRVTIKGSDTMVILVQRWSELYPDKKNVEFQVTGGGSGTGVAALINGTAALINAVSKDPNSIGFGGAAYAKNVKAIAVSKDGSGKGVVPSDKAIHSGEYPISRFLYFYLNQKPSGNIKKFIDWVISPAGQKVVTEVGYYPIRRK